VVQSKQPGAEERDRGLGADAASEKLAKALEQVSPEDGLFSEAPPTIIRYTAPGSAARLPVR